MRKLLVLGLMCGVLAGCGTAREEGGVVNKVLGDFGLKSRPEGYVTGADKIFDHLGAVGVAEMKRMNMEEQRGRVKFQQEGDLRGKYYREIKKYESYYPIDSKAVTSTNDNTYTGLIDYEYRLYQSARKDSAALAEGESADIPTDIVGRERYRYTFDSVGNWDGAKGQKAKNK